MEGVTHTLAPMDRSDLHAVCRWGFLHVAVHHESQVLHNGGVFIAVSVHFLEWDQGVWVIIFWSWEQEMPLAMDKQHHREYLQVATKEEGDVVCHSNRSIIPEGSEPGGSIGKNERRQEAMENR